MANYLFGVFDNLIKIYSTKSLTLLYTIQIDFQNKINSIVELNENQISFLGTNKILYFYKLQEAKMVEDYHINIAKNTKIMF